MAKVVWETCLGCKAQFAYPHLCRVHSLCGICHPQYAQALLELEETAERDATQTMRRFYRDAL